MFSVAIIVIFVALSSPAQALSRYGTLFNQTQDYLVKAEANFRSKVGQVEERQKVLGAKATTCNGFGDCTKCYGELGCFRSGGNFLKWPERPVSFLPAPRDKISTRFYLYTRRNRDTKAILKANDANSVVKSKFSKDKPTKFIIHGFLHNGEIKWMKGMKDALLDVDDCNVILVDWGRGSGLPYTMATANTRLVGAEIALLINYLAADHGVKPLSVHLVGHSLGAHIAGYAGERVHALGRITGLDPADPYFKNTHPEVRLDPTDSTFVDVIHTDMKPFLSSLFSSLEGFGLEQPLGHLDFYPNGGLEQPGCDKGSVFGVVLTDGLSTGIQHYATCSHQRAVDYMTWSIKSKDRNAWLGFVCDSYDKFSKGECVTCGSNNQDCSPMGYYAAPIRPGKEHIRLFSKTFNKKPFEGYNHQVVMTLSESSKHSGDVFFTIYGKQNVMTSDVQVATKMPLEAGTTRMFLVRSPVDLGAALHLTFRWKCNSNLFSPLTLCTSTVVPQYVVPETFTVLNIHGRVCFNGDGTKVSPDKVKTFTMGKTC